MNVKALWRYKRTELRVRPNNGQTEVTCVFLEHGADANAKYNNNDAPIHWAWNEGYSCPYRVWCR